MEGEHVTVVDQSWVINSSGKNNFKIQLAGDKVVQLKMSASQRQTTIFFAVVFAIFE